MLVPLHGVKRGGSKCTNKCKYAIVNENGKSRALALIKNSPNSRYINVISGFTRI